MLYIHHQAYEPSISIDGSTVTLVHFGEYKYLCEAYIAMGRFLKDNFLTAKGEIATDYVKNCTNTSNSDSYVTVLTAKVNKNEAFTPGIGGTAYA